MAARPAQGRRRRAPDDVPPAGRLGLGRSGSTTTTGSTSTCGRTATPPNSPAATTQTRADYDRSPAKPVLDGEPLYEDHPVSFNAKQARPLDRRRRPPAALLGPVQRRVRAHLRPPFGLADVAAGPHADQRSADALVRGARSARRGADAARPPAARIAAVPDAHPRRFGHRDRPRGDVRPGRGPLPLRGDARPGGNLRDGLCAGRPAVLRCGWTSSRGRRSRPGGTTREPAEPPRSASSPPTGHARFAPPAAGEATDWVLVLDDAAKATRLPGSLRTPDLRRTLAALEANRTGSSSISTRCRVEARACRCPSGAGAKRTRAGELPVPPKFIPPMAWCKS